MKNIFKSTKQKEKEKTEVIEKGTQTFTEEYKLLAQKHHRDFIALLQYGNQEIKAILRVIVINTEEKK